MSESETYLLLPLTDREVDVVVDALVAFAEACEQEGDVCGVAPHADRAAERARKLRTLSEAGVEQSIRMAGLGRYRLRPQG